MATKFVEKSPGPECTALLGSKVMQGSSGDNQGSSCLEMPYGHQICWEESLTSVMYCCNQFCNIKWHLWNKIRKGNLYLTKNRFERNEIWFALAFRIVSGWRSWIKKQNVFGGQKGLATKTWETSFSISGAKFKGILNFVTLNWNLWTKICSLFRYALCTKYSILELKKTFFKMFACVFQGSQLGAFYPLINLEFKLYLWNCFQ